MDIRASGPASPGPSNTYSLGCRLPAAQARLPDQMQTSQHRARGGRGESSLDLGLFKEECAADKRPL